MCLCAAVAAATADAPCAVISCYDNRSVYLYIGPSVCQFACACLSLYIYICSVVCFVGCAQVFLKELSAAVGYTVSITFGTSAGVSAEAVSGAAAAPAPPGSEAAKPAFESVEQMQNIVFQSRKLGYIPGVFLVQKSGGEAELFKLETYNSTDVTLARQQLGQTTNRFTIDTHKLLAEYRIHKGTVTELLPGYALGAANCCPLQSQAWKLECAKARVSLALRRVYSLMQVMCSEVDLFVKPNMVRVKSEWQIGEFFLAPASMRIERKLCAGSICLGRFDLGGAAAEALYMLPHFAPPISLKGEPVKHAWVCPFWHVGDQTLTAKANLALKAFEVTIEDTKVRIPVLVNIKALEVGTELLMDKSLVKAFSSSRITIAESDFNKSAKKRKLI